MTHTLPRRQQTIRKPASVRGFGLFHGANVTLQFCPADVDHGVVFERVDLVDPVQIPALIDHVTPEARCTMITRQGAGVCVIEHVMAALAGLRVDNCLVRIDAPEPPIGDGSAQLFVEALLRAGIVEQDAPRVCLRVPRTFASADGQQTRIVCLAPQRDELEIGFRLDYGSGAIPRQSFRTIVTPETFVTELAACRTFVLESEARQLRAAGLCQRATTQNALVFNEHGVLENSLRFPNECARHKILDCLGDFALLGCDLSGWILASRSGHRLNHEIVRQFRAAAVAGPSPVLEPISIPIRAPFQHASQADSSQHVPIHLKAG